LPITITQQQIAINQQITVAHDMSPQVRLIAGPGSGKSKCIEERVNYLLSNGVLPGTITVISFTRATASNLKRRVTNHCVSSGNGHLVSQVHISTMHGLALRILRQARLLRNFPADPVILDEWEQENIFDAEFALKHGLPNSRAKAIRLAYDAYWQTMQNTRLVPITATERSQFNVYDNATKRNYSCVLAGEVIRDCVDGIRNQTIQASTTAMVKYLIVDEYQDLNTCDQDFVQLLTANATSLFAAGDDDQSIYSFRHANPTGLINFMAIYPRAHLLQLDYCWRCMPNVLNAAVALLRGVAVRVTKTIQSLYSHSTPPVTGAVHVWKFASGQREAKAIAESCNALIRAGLDPSEILILVSNIQMQIPLLDRELTRLGIAFSKPRNNLTNSPIMRFILALTNILDNPNNYVAHRTILGLIHGVGVPTCFQIGQKAIANNLNYRNLFYTGCPARMFAARENAAIRKATAVFSIISSWNTNDLLQARYLEIAAILQANISPALLATYVPEWQSLSTTFPPQMTLGDLCDYLSAYTDAERINVIQAIGARQPSPPGGLACTTLAGGTRCLKILTMHGAKGLDARVVFIPCIDHGVLPSTHVLGNPAAYEEQRRLLYVSITRARVACVLSCAGARNGNQTSCLGLGSFARFTPSQFIYDMNLAVQNRQGSLSSAEIMAIMSDCANI